VVEEEWEEEEEEDQRAADSSGDLGDDVLKVLLRWEVIGDLRDARDDGLYTGSLVCRLHECN
jgi:hypothetical protein